MVDKLNKDKDINHLKVHLKNLKIKISMIERQIEELETLKSQFVSRTSFSQTKKLIAVNFQTGEFIYDR